MDFGQSSEILGLLARITEQTHNIPVYGLCDGAKFVVP